MVLYSFDTIHPALLTNQVLAAKLPNAKFILELAANPARQVCYVALGLVNLNTAIVSLEALAKYAANGFLHLAPKTMADDKSDPLVYVSTSTIVRCEEACNTIG